MQRPEFFGSLFFMDILQRYIDHQIDAISTFPDRRQEKRASLFVVIPCYNEPDILATLNSLANCNPPAAEVSVLVVINHAEDAPDEAIAQNISTSESILQWQSQHQHLFFDVQRILAPALPKKWAGVGWARKIGMDESVRLIAKNNLPDGIIVSFDADSTVLPNYLQTIESAFSGNPDCNFFTIHFEHPYNNPALSASFREGIIRYELHMRYYRNALQWSGYPHAIHTVGSSFALKASAYAKQGGMNRRKAGEDFYFLHKLVLLGQYGNISSTTVIPAARQSDRVPFGTGAAMKKWAEGNSELNFTYSLGPFSNLKPLFENTSQLWQMGSAELEKVIANLHPSLQSFCKDAQLIDKILELSKNCSNTFTFEKRIFHLMDAFWILKYLNSAHETFYSRGDLRTEAISLLQHIGIQVEIDSSLENLLEIFRKLDTRFKNCS
ncbi:MAG TPA: glycosyltransferase family 2 protein [Prolixibacteraceae bacterium]